MPFRSLLPLIARLSVISLLFISFLLFILIVDKTIRQQQKLFISSITAKLSISRTIALFSTIEAETPPELATHPATLDCRFHGETKILTAEIL
jgi:hypothetical protein